jgi:hypothetical protein
MRFIMHPSATCIASVHVSMPRSTVVRTGAGKIVTSPDPPVRRDSCGRRGQRPPTLRRGTGNAVPRLLADDLADALGRSARRPPLHIEAWAVARGIRGPDPVLAEVQQADRAESISTVLDHVTGAMEDLSAAEFLDLWRIGGLPVQAG